MLFLWVDKWVDKSPIPTKKEPPERLIPKIIMQELKYNSQKQQITSLKFTCE